MEYIFRTATSSDITRIMEIMEQAKRQMYRECKKQWDETYPVQKDIARDLGRGEAYVMLVKENIVAYGAVVFDGEPVYSSLRGKWLSEVPCVVLHRLAVADEMKRKGVATLFMEKVEGLGRTKGVRSFKVDTNYDNFYMQKIFKKLGFSYCGEVFYQKGFRMAYEKII